MKILTYVIGGSLLIIGLLAGVAALGLSQESPEEAQARAQANTSQIIQQFGQIEGTPPNSQDATVANALATDTAEHYRRLREDRLNQLHTTEVFCIITTIGGAVLVFAGIIGKQKSPIACKSEPPKL
jgi:hypothetical protein